ncbi:immunity 26/phosphotriesterase HocA family protein [Marinibactrum halimedae]|uniref:Immunity protein 26 n=1 Tax=Marinibactrum halimedae TaxID=1444977 RepID=A0AA37T645_9GAMM|nr:immunity 26/phosphotriesterase HocA family protein [Marinibactrum halimedae]MCD9461256.1 immunity 26/phosphotriesterase HocA family protein [Marinibactrum halimedae]GLS27585.1 hypothetical protein GCM10007877_33040 [Marinibactrum halimedae]
MIQSNKNLKIGDVFTVPLRDSTTATGLIITLSKNRGIRTIFGYFFDLSPAELINLYHSKKLQQELSVYAGMYGGLGFIDNSWEVVDNIPDFPIDKWEQFEFRNLSLTSNTWRKSIYDSNIDSVDMIISSEKECKDLFEDGLSGAIAVQNALSLIILDKKPLPPIARPKEPIKRF